MFTQLVGNERLGELDQTPLPSDQGKETETFSKHTRSISHAVWGLFYVESTMTPLWTFLCPLRALKKVSTEIEKKQKRREIRWVIESKKCLHIAFNTHGVSV